MSSDISPIFSCKKLENGFISCAFDQKERFPSGQREQTVNLPAQPSEVRILPSPNRIAFQERDFRMRLLIWNDFDGDELWPGFL